MSRSQRRFGTSYRHIKIKRGESRHHRKPRSRKGTDNDENISIVKQTDHNAWHQLFANLDPETIARIISERWIDPAYKFICVKL